MLKGFRNLIQRLDELDDEDSSVSVHAPAVPPAVELPQSLEVPAPPPEAPAAFILYGEEKEASELATSLKVMGVEPQAFADTGAFVRALLTRQPAIAFLHVAEAGDGAIDVLFAMSERRYAGPIQLVADQSPVVNLARRVGERLSLNMLSPLTAPLTAQAVRQVLASQRIKLLPATSATLREALASNLVEFWFQPKIDLGKRQIAGVELFARVRHPELGTLSPGIFLQGATEADLIRLTERGLGAALRSASGFLDAGIHLRVAVNVPLRALFELPVTRMIQEIGPASPRWPGLLFDVSVSQLAADLDRIEAFGAELTAANAKLAIDDFGRSSLSLAALKRLPVAELKLDRSFVNGCSDDPARAKVCASVIDLAHRIGCVAVAVGIERSADARLLAEMGCDVGQGYLFGEPMPEQDLAAMLMKRAVAAASVRPAANKSAAAAGRSSPVASQPDTPDEAGAEALAAPKSGTSKKKAAGPMPVTKSKMTSRRPTPAYRSPASLKRTVWN